MIRRARRARDERGAVAIMVAALVALLFATAALTVDLAKAYVEKNDIQKRADFSALAGAVGDNLPGAAPGTCGYGPAALASDQAIVDVAAYLSERPGGSDVTAADLVDCDLTDGEAGFGMFRAGGCPGGTCLVADPNQLSVVSQPRNVSFGLASVLGFTDVDVRGEATVEIKTPLMAGLPFYAFTGCDYGNQTISQPNNGQAADTILLSHAGETNPARLTTLAVYDGASPPVVPSNAVGPQDVLTINAEAGTLTGVTAIGFFLSGTVSGGPEPEVVPAADFSSASGASISLTIPGSVTSTDALWYVRVKRAGSWSPVTTGNGNNQVLRALGLTVGAPVLTCGQGSSSGNFGTLDLPPNGVSGLGVNEQVAYNIIHGVDPGLSTFPTDQLLPPDYRCTSSPSGTILWPEPGTNCVPTQTGMSSQSAEKGFITGFGSYPDGLLAKDADDSSTHCPHDYPSGTSHTTVLRGRTVNDDILTCFLENDTVTVGQVSSPGYAGSAVIDQAIFDSPRFVLVPVVGSQPANGGSQKYQILNFRPGFITDQPANATRVTGVPTRTGTLSGNSATGTSNGITYDRGQLNSVNVVFINAAALPNPPQGEDGTYIPFTGSGEKVALLVN